MRITKASFSFFLLSVLILACTQEPYVQGKRIYDTYCLNCHMEDGSGLGELYPSLNNSLYLSSQKDQLACLIQNGIRSDQLSTVYMPAHYQIEPAAMTNLINYLSYRWGKESVITLAEVNNQLIKCPRK